MAATSGYLTYAGYLITGNRVLGGWGSLGSFDGILQAKVTALRIDSPEAEVADMTTISDGLGYRRLVPTGVVTNGLITIDFLYDTTEQIEVALLAATTGTLTIYSGDGVYTPQLIAIYEVICKAAYLESRVGDAVRFQAQFIPIEDSTT